MEEGNLADQIVFDYGMRPYEDPARDTQITAYVCPSYEFQGVFSSAQPGFEYQNGALITYAGSAGADTDGLLAEDLLDTQGYGLLRPNGALTMKKVFPRPGNPSYYLTGVSRKGSQITDGQSNSFLIGEFVDRPVTPPVFAKMRPDSFGPGTWAASKARLII